jgi:hypothetical protein
VTLLRRLIPVLLSATVLLTIAPAASAQSIFADCTDGRLDGQYSPSEIRKARQNIPTDVDEYTDCRDVLTSALDGSLDHHRGGGKGDGNGASGGAATGGGGTSGSSGGGTSGGSGGAEILTPATPEEHDALQRARDSAAPVAVGSEAVVPNAAGLSPDAVRQDIPTPLLVVLILLAILSAAAAAKAMRTRVLDRLRRR